MHALALALSLSLAKHKPPPPPPDPRPYSVEHYAIALDVDAAAGKFTTTTAVTLTPREALAAVQLDAEFAVQAARVDETEATFSTSKTPDGHTLLVVTPATPLVAGKSVRVVVRGSGEIQSGASLGMLRSDDPEHAGRSVVYTMFEPDGARRVFACDDRPASKATFDINVTTDTKLDVISVGTRTGDQKVESEDGKHVVSWKQDKPQSTYSVGVAIGAFEAASVDGAAVPASIFVAPGDTARARSAVGATRAAMAYLADFLETPFPWARYDQVAIPQFTWNGMENTTAAFERASRIEPHSDAFAERNQLDALVDHELAHQWFGDDVTPAQWQEVWLNESFATYLERLAVNDLTKNDWSFLQASLDDRSIYFRFEDSPRSRPVVGPAATDEDVFDAATYLKGAAVLRMLDQYVGRAVFRNALKNFLAAHAYGTATSDQFVDAVASASGKDLAAFKQSWLRESGYPIVKFTRRWLPGEKQLAVNVEQRPNKPGKRTVWVLPFMLVAHRSADPAYNLQIPLVLDKASDTVGLELPAEPDWVDWNQGDVVLARIETAEKTDALISEASKDPDPMARLWADLELAGSMADPDRKAQLPGQAEQDALAAVLLGDHSPYVRAALLQELARGGARHLPTSLGAAALEEAVAPRGLSDDPVGLAALKRAGLAELGHVDDPAVPSILSRAVRDPGVSIDQVTGAARGLGIRGDASSVEALKAALASTADRGLPFLRAVLEGLCAVQDPSVVPDIQAQAVAHKDSLELLTGMQEALSENRALLRSGAGTQMAASMAADGRFDAEVRVRWLNLLDDVKTPAARSALAELARNGTPRIAAVAKQKLKGNFGK